MLNKKKNQFHQIKLSVIRYKHLYQNIPTSRWYRIMQPQFKLLNFRLTGIDPICVWWIRWSKNCDILDEHLAVNPLKISFKSPLAHEAPLEHQCKELTREINQNPRRDKPAIYRVDGPKRWVDESKIWDNHSFWVHQFYEMRSSIVQSVVVKPLPPNTALAINSPIATWRKLIVKSV